MGSFRAVTLIELVIIITVSAILALVALPGINSYFDVKLDACVQKVVSDVRYTQYLAIAEHKSYGIKFFPQDNSYQVYDPGTGDLARDPYTGMDMEVDLDESSEYLGIDIVSVNIDSGDEVRFTSLGKPLNSSAEPLSNVGEIIFFYNGRSKKVLIYPETGWVEIQ